MYRSTTSFTTKDYDVRPKQILEDDFTSEEQIQEFLRIGYIEVYDGTLEITENGQYDVEDYQIADVDVPSSEPTLQSKEVTITENGTTTVTADAGYDGLSDVDVTVNVSGGSSIPDWTEIGYSGVPQTILDGYSYAKNIYDNWDSTQTSMQYKYENNKDIVYMPFVDTSNVTNMNSAFKGCLFLQFVPTLNTSKVTNMNSMFNFDNLKASPMLDTSSVTSMYNMFASCTHLVEVPEYNTSKVTNMSNMFAYTNSLSNESLNNILAMCINSAVTSTKTLKYIGLSSSQATTCQSLSNWDAFVTAGWTTGY